METGGLAADAVRYCEQQMLAGGVFFGHGTERAIDESIALVCHVLQFNPNSQDWSQHPLDDKQGRVLDDLLEQRIEERIPMAYILGHAWFANLRFKVDPAVLIPRSPIAELIENQFELWLDTPRPRILDLCTGCACIAIACAIHLPGARVDATDLSATALELAAENVALHRLDDRVFLHQSDLFDQLDARRYELILSNPPYVGVDEMASLPPEYHREPVMALESGIDGLDLPLKILRDAAGCLEDNGVLIMEVGNSDQLLQSVLPRVPFMWLEFEYGGHGVLVLDRRQLQAARADVLALLAERELSGKESV